MSASVPIVTVAPIVRRRAALVAWMPALPLLGILFAFTLPFVTVTCDGESTEPISGMELVLGDEPVMAGDRSQAPENIRNVVRDTSRIARVDFALVFVALVLLVWAGIASSSINAAFCLLLANLGVLFGLAAMFGVGFQLWIDSHHLYGFWSASILAAAAVELGYSSLSTRFVQGRSVTPFSAVMFGLSLVGLAAVFAGAITPWALVAVVAAPVAFIGGLVRLRRSPTSVDLAATVVAGILVFIVVGAMTA